MSKRAWLAMAVMLSCVACTAKEKEYKGNSVQEHKDNPIAEDFRRIDANHDGKLTPNEIERYVVSNSSMAQGQAKAAK